MSKKKSVRDYIPNLDNLFNKVKEFVEAHQGEKGYIDCQPSLNLDIIYGIMYEDFTGGGVEQYVYAVRVKNNDIEILLEPIMRTYRTVYQPEDFVNAEADEKWFSVRWSDVYYVPTLFNIAESIEEYV